MPNVIITGAQWGDEGKGKIVDFLTETADMVVRGAGGNNAGGSVAAVKASTLIALASVNGPMAVRTSAAITAAVPSDAAMSRPSERMYVPLPQRTSSTTRGYA